LKGVGTFKSFKILLKNNTEKLQLQLLSKIYFW